MTEFKYFDKLLKRLGKYKSTQFCLYIKKLKDINIRILEKLIPKSVRYIMQKHRNIK